MSYTIPTDVQNNYMGTNFEDSDFIKTATVTRWIDEYSSEIDMSLRRKYALPITDADDLTFLKTLCEMFVVGKIDDLLRHGATDTEKEFLRLRNYTKTAEKKMMLLMNGTLLLKTAAKSLVAMAYLRRDV